MGVSWSSPWALMEIMPQGASGSSSRSPYVHTHIELIFPSIVKWREKCVLLDSGAGGHQDIVMLVLALNAMMPQGARAAPRFALYTDGFSGR